MMTPDRRSPRKQATLSARRNKNGNARRCIIATRRFTAPEKSIAPAIEWRAHQRATGGLTHLQALRARKWVNRPVVSISRQSQAALGDDVPLNFAGATGDGDAERPEPVALQFSFQRRPARALT